ncbi:MAG: plasmid pRiA4b ORF-3 family protein [Nitrospinota bacterium]|nr:plasmid pRiA4b ORF-3 family protein [Nitrospinota bacterium]
MNQKIFLLKISLKEIEPKIWRRFIVPTTITLDRLHDVIQIIMGWKDYHLYEFLIDGKVYTENPADSTQGAEVGKHILGDLINRKGGKFQYLYDFGDYWEHEVILENRNYSNPDIEVNLTCLEGERSCPPEDVGGSYGYYDFCEGISDSNHPQHQEYLDWFSDLDFYDSQEFKCESFSAEKTNIELMKYLRWSRQRLSPWL